MGASTWSISACEKARRSTGCAKLAPASKAANEISNMRKSRVMVGLLAISVSPITRHGCRRTPDLQGVTTSLTKALRGLPGRTAGEKARAQLPGALARPQRLEDLALAGECRGVGQGGAVEHGVDRLARNRLRGRKVANTPLGGGRGRRKSRRAQVARDDAVHDAER